MKTTILTFLVVCLSGETGAYLTRNVIICVVDGARYTETFGDTSKGHAGIPFIWNTLRPQGTIYTNFYCGGNGIPTVTCEGHATILTGNWQNIANDGSVRAFTPTIFEYFRRQTGSTARENFVILGKDKLSILTYSDSTGYGADFGALVQMAPSATLQSSDTATWSNIKFVLRTYHPRQSIINMPQVDYDGHSGIWDNYITSIRRADSLVCELWKLIQTDSIYKNTTTLFITNDHGRHTTNFTSHGDQCEGCRHIMLMVLGPDAKEGEVDSLMRYQIDIAPTIGMLLGYSTPDAIGSSLFPDSSAIGGVSRPKANYENGISHLILMQQAGSIIVNYFLPMESTIGLSIVDLAGKKRKKNADCKVQKGFCSATISTSGLAAGSYFLLFKSRNIYTVKMFVISK
jgi:hypothetical protein